MAISTLPHEMWAHVLSYCDAADVWRLALTCREAACTALDPVHILGPGYRRAAARLCTGHMCLARLGAIVDDDFFEAAEPAPLGIVRDDDCRRAEGADDKAQRTDLKHKVLDGDGWYRVGARRLVETAPPALPLGGSPSLCHLPPSLVHSIGPLAAWALVDVAAHAQRRGLCAGDPAQCGVQWLAGDGVRGPALCVDRQSATSRKWTWGFCRGGRQVGPGVAITDATRNTEPASLAMPIVGFAWTWAQRWHCLLWMDHLPYPWDHRPRARSPCTVPRRTEAVRPATRRRLSTPTGAVAYSCVPSTPRVALSDHCCGSAGR
ncbi:F-box incomplete domain containing protein [Pandoravirus salinus]|uniref:F-box incomplete domain containing protein n=1 Tax=Pandoravirus salinus TaxID=1349410 RepID=S4W1E1_9VIRU|nr:F-box incomplete domain [Pandoravirus salinus]AGO84247.1 F-box incomplete domain containing protein [Pandoravirus salinus]